MLILIMKVIVYWIVGMIISVLIHEMGHLLAGMINGWKFYLLIIGPVKIYRENINEKIKIKLEKNVAYWGGTAASIPSVVSEKNIDIWAKVLLAGPLSSLIAALIFVPFTFIFKSLFFLMASLVCLALGLVNIIPFSFRTGFFFNDGKRYSRLKSGGIEAEEERAIFKIVETFSVYGDDAVPNLDACRCLIKSDDKIFKYYGYCMLYNYAKKTGDGGKMRNAMDNIEVLKENMNPNVISMVAPE